MTVEKLFVIGDIHGQYSALETILKDLNEKEKAFKTFDLEKNIYEIAEGVQIITLGDYIDRGPSSKKVLDTLIALSQDKNYFALLGNHELLSLACLDEAKDILECFSDDSKLARWMYDKHTIHGLNAGGKTIKEFSTGNFIDALKEYVAEFSSVGRYGIWLRSRQPYKMVDVCGKKVFCVHAGVSDSLNSSAEIEKFENFFVKHMSLKTVNSKEKFFSKDFLGEEGIFWIREKFFNKSKEELEINLKNIGADIAIIGHTPDVARGKVRSFHNLVYDIDVGMSEAYGKHMPAYICITKEEATAVYCRVEEKI